MIYFRKSITYRREESMEKKGKEPDEVQSVVKTIAILEALAKEGELGLTDLATKIGSHKSTVYRFMCTLCEQGYARRDTDTERFSLTLKIFELGMGVFGRVDLVKLAAPVIARLSATTEETIHLATLDDQRLVYLSKVESTHSLRVGMQSRVGMSAPEYCTGVGKVLLAWSDTDLLEAYLSRCQFVRYTEKTITDRLKLAAELQAIRNQGWAMDDEEHEYGVRCVAAPVRDIQGKVVAALSVSGPSVRMSYERLDVLKGLVVDAASEISGELGHKKGVRK